MNALTEALAAARKELDEHKATVHGGHYLIGCPLCWAKLCRLRDMTNAVGKADV